MKRVRWIVEAVLVVIFSFPFAVLPYKLSLKAGELLGLLAFYTWADRRRIAVGNIERAAGSGQLSLPGSGDAAGAAVGIAKENFRNYGKSLAEVVRIYYGFGDSIVRNVVVKGKEFFNQAEARGRGVILITGHCGNWELLALATGVKLAPASGVARMLDNPYLNRIIERIRTRYGNTVIYKKGALKGILSCLKKKGNVGILMDQAVLRDEGFIVDFLGRGAWTTKMPALIARKTGAAVIPVFLNREGPAHVMTLYPAVPLNYDDTSESALKDDTQRISNYIAEYIRQHPSEWLWIHRRWKRVDD